ncbi:YopX family protein [Clostridium sp.]|uniref:YopX family protein n=1 Tax=Clostridium sp. TaxID=1506 RepID=UPI002909D887|nr:YopX family protein [Clostridium sp.]MDU4726368.1 YopX family protein [Clostridium sp.]
MSRVRKFRVWDRDYKSMHIVGDFHHDSLEIDEDNNIYYLNLQCMETSPYKRVDPEHCAYRLMEYTGLKDKNGKEIYEGDIIKYSHKAVGEIKREVRYKYGMYGIEGRYEGGQIPFANILGSEREVVGNIYENPELLEGN